MPEYQFTPYFENEVLRKRLYLTKELCVQAVGTCESSHSPISSQYTTHSPIGDSRHEAELLPGH